MAQITPEEKPFNTGLFILLGVVFWLVGVLFIRFGGKALFVKDSPWPFVLFVSYIPTAWVFVKTIAVVGQVSDNTLLRAVSLSAFTAALLDGITFTCFQSLFGFGQAGLLLAAAWLLWGTGVGLGVGYWASR